MLVSLAMGTLEKVSGYGVMEALSLEEAERLRDKQS